MPSARNSGTFDTSIRQWLDAMQKAKKIQPGGKLLFVNKRTGQAIQTKGSAPAPEPSAPQTVRAHPIDELRSQGMVIGKSKKRSKRG